MRGHFKAGAAALVLMSAQSATAGPEYYLPAGTYTSVTGTFIIQELITLNCSVNITIYTEVDGSAAWVTSIALSGGYLGLCAIYTFEDIPYPLYVSSPGPGGTGPANTVLMQGTKLKGLGYCGGDIPWSWSTTYATTNNVILTGLGTPPADCTVSAHIALGNTLTFGRY